MRVDFSMRWPRARRESLRLMQTASTRRKRSPPSLRQRSRILRSSSSALGGHSSEKARAGGTSRIALRIWISWAAGRPMRTVSQDSGSILPDCFRDSLKHGRQQSFVFESEVMIEAARRGVRFVFIPIGVAPRVGARTSHFRPVVDIVRITKMIALKLLSRGLYPQGFYRAFIRRPDPTMRPQRMVVTPRAGMGSWTARNRKPCLAPCRRRRCGLNSPLR